ncbi:hypothetical protein DFR52_102746 [Hoeflea marina]|uniref:Glycosyl transferase family 1 n=2 Tax=Hoeflea marina TaxID=274592 RepID=A0A317PPK3_9HYPH|nr:hypothetical protein DFR52_102746 [Hoeflea marina]
MRILIVNERMSKRTGTEIATRDLAQGLSHRRHEVVVLAEETGPLAEEVRAAGVPVTDTIAGIGMFPDVIHFNDLGMAVEVSSAFPAAAACLQWHRTVPATFSIAGTNISVLCGVSPRINEKMAWFGGVDTDGLLNNTVDLTGFRARATPLPPVPGRWLLVGQQKRGYGLMLKLKWLAMRHGATLDLVGPRFFRRVSNLPEHTRSYDLVFASGRCALEAACSGAGVIVTDYHGVADFLGSGRVKRYYQGNFSYRLFGSPVTARSLAAAIAEYDPEQAALASAWLRTHADLEVGLDRTLALYRLAIARRAGRLA